MIHVVRPLSEWHPLRCRQKFATPHPKWGAKGDSCKQAHVLKYQIQQDWVSYNRSDHFAKLFLVEHLGERWP